MEVLELTAWSSVARVLTSDQARAIGASGLATLRPGAHAGEWQVETGSSVGVVIGTDWEIRVAPKLDVAHLFFLLGYAANPRGWQEQSALFAKADLVSAVASGFAFQAARALEQGVLRGYVTLEERLPAVRGRIAFDRLVTRGSVLPLPIDVTFSDFTENIQENRILKTAALLLLRLPRVPGRARRRLNQLVAFLDGVDALERPREVVLPQMTRLNKRYESALQLAYLVLRNSGVDAPRGQYRGAAFVFDMNKVFEDFVTVALEDALRRSHGRYRPQWSGHLDLANRVGIQPDITWWQGSSARIVADAKYKALGGRSFPNADMYQMLAYCSVLGLRRGYLIYARQSGEERRVITVRNAGVEIAVRTLDVELAPVDLIREAEELAAEMIAYAKSTDEAVGEATVLVTP